MGAAIKKALANKSATPKPLEATVLLRADQGQYAIR